MEIVEAKSIVIPDSITPRFEKVKIAYVFLIGWSCSLIVFVLWSSRQLRPAADDYSIGSSTQSGPLAATLMYWNLWSGDVSSIFANVVLVGWPLQELPWSLGSSLPFIANGLMVAILLTTIVRASVVGMHSRSLFRMVSTIPFFLLAWWSFFWINRILNPENLQFHAEANATTFWQSVNITYVFVPSLIMWLIYKIYARSKKNQDSKWNYVIFFISGVFIGLSTPVIVTATLIYLMLQPISVWLDGRPLIDRNFSLWSTFVFTMVPSAVISNLSPGTQRRLTFLPDVELNRETILLLPPSIIPSLLDWWKTLFNQGMFATIVLVLAVAIMLEWRGFEFNSKFLREIANRIIIFSLIASIVVGVSEVFTYVAYWHRIFVHVSLWIGLVLLTFSYNSYLTRLRPQLSQIVFVSVLVMSFFTVAVFRMSGEISKRYEMWQVGPAPVEYVSDIEDTNGWQRDCYLKLVMQRGGPDRGTSSSLAIVETGRAVWETNCIS